MKGTLKVERENAATALLRRLSLGIGSSAMSHGIGALQSFGLVPFFFRGWGAETYGRWLALTAMISYLSLFDFGGQTYVGNLLAIAQARNERSVFVRGLSQGVSLFLALGLAAFAALLIVLGVALRVPLPGLHRSLEHWEVLVIGALAANFLVLSLPGGVYITAYRATGLFARGTMVANVTRLVGLVAMVGALSLRVSPTVLALLILGIGVVGTAALVLDSRRCIPQCLSLRIHWENAKAGWRELRGGAFQFWKISIAQALGQQAIVLVVAASAGPEGVVLYSTHRTLSNIPSYVGGLLQAPILPELSAMWGRGQLETMFRTARFSIRLAVLLTGILALAVWIAAPVVYPAWTDKQLRISSGLLATLLVDATIAAGGISAAWMMLATNHHRSVAQWSLVNSVIGLGLAAILLPRLGVVGAAVGTFAGNALCAGVVLPLLSARFIKVKVREIYCQIGSAWLVLVPATSLMLISSLWLKGWWSVGLFGIASCVLAYPALRVALGRTATHCALSLLLPRVFVCPIESGDPR